METNSKIKSLADNTNAVQESYSKKKLTTKWDKCIDDYKNYTIEYIKHYKKSLKGNLVSVSKYAYMKSKSEELCKRLNKAHDKNRLDEKQLNRLSKIKMKMLQVCCA